jgi:hypothetical protein
MKQIGAGIAQAIDSIETPEHPQKVPNLLSSCRI